MNFSNRISRTFGAFAQHKFPRQIQIFINYIYVKIFDIDLKYFKPLEEYDSLNALFTRQLQIPRPLEEGIISPCDCKIFVNSTVKDQLALQIKGKSYNVYELLNPLDEGERLENFDDFKYINLYLSPSDYHRFHAPCDCEVLEIRHFYGTLLPVNTASLLKNENLFIKNERVVLVLKSDDEIWYFVAVGALNVGQIKINFCPTLHTNTATNKNYETYNLKTPIILKKGDEIGTFMMGSTILLFAKSMQFTAKTGTKINFGATIGHFIK